MSHNGMKIFPYFYVPLIYLFTLQLSLFRTKLIKILTMLWSNDHAKFS